MTHVFISYVREDTPIVDKLVSSLESRGINVWLDRNDISVGVRWAEAIKNAIRQGSFFLACFSKQYYKKSKTYMNEELTLAIEELRLRPTDRAWFLPILLDDCNIPDRPIGAGESLADIQYVSLYTNWNAGLNKLFAALGTTTSETDITEKKTIHQLAQDFYQRGRSPYQNNVRGRGRRLVEIVLSLPEIAIEENQRWLLWELFHALLENKKYTCVMRLGLERGNSENDKIFSFLLFDRWAEHRYIGVLTNEEARKGLWKGSFNTMVDTRVSSAGMQKENHRFSWRREYAPATQENPYLGEDIRPTLETILGKAQGMKEGERGSFLYDIQHILMGSFGRGLEFIFGHGRNDMCNQYSPLVRQEHDEANDMLVLEIYDTFFRSLKYTCVCSKHWSHLNEAGLDFMSNEAEIWLGLA